MIRLCLTIDTDPDGVTAAGGPHRDRLRFDALERIASLRDAIASAAAALDTPIPVTWFIRCDDQIAAAFGDATHLLETFGSLWRDALAAGDELGWHAHLYDLRAAPPALERDPRRLTGQLERCWHALREKAARLSLTGENCWQSFRSGEGYLTPAITDCVERLGIRIDSSVIPGRRDASDWRHAPREPYHPADDDSARAGPTRRLLEVPMRTWLVRAPYDPRPRVRYVNPAIHPALFAQALRRWLHTGGAMDEPGRADAIWVMVLHPDEALPAGKADALYARDPQAVRENLCALVRALRDAGCAVEFGTMQWALERRSDEATKRRGERHEGTEARRHEGGVSDEATRRRSEQGKGSAREAGGQTPPSGKTHGGQTPSSGHAEPTELRTDPAPCGQPGAAVLHPGAQGAGCRAQGTGNREQGTGQAPQHGAQEASQRRGGHGFALRPSNFALGPCPTRFRHSSFDIQHSPRGGADFALRSSLFDLPERDLLARTGAAAVFWSGRGAEALLWACRAAACVHAPSTSRGLQSARSSTAPDDASARDDAPEVIIPAICCPSVAHAASMAGLRVRVADVDPATGLLTAETARQRLTPRTCAIVFVHLFGQTAGVAAVRTLCDAHGLLLIEDAAQALGATIEQSPERERGVGQSRATGPHGQPGAAGPHLPAGGDWPPPAGVAIFPRSVGRVGDFCVLSFSRTKILPAGGGALIVRDAALAEAVRRSAPQASDKPYRVGHGGPTLQEKGGTSAGSAECQPGAAGPHWHDVREPPLSFDRLARAYRDLTHRLAHLHRLGAPLRTARVYARLARHFDPLFVRNELDAEALAAIWPSLESRLERRHRLAELYARELADGPWSLLDGWRSSGVCWRFSLLLDDPALQPPLVQGLRLAGFHASTLYPPLSIYFDEPQPCPAAEAFWRRVVNLWVDESVEEAYVRRCAATLVEHARRLDGRDVNRAAGATETRRAWASDGPAVGA